MNQRSCFSQVSSSEAPQQLILQSLLTIMRTALQFYLSKRRLRDLLTSHMSRTWSTRRTTQLFQQVESSPIRLIYSRSSTIERPRIMAQNNPSIELLMILQSLMLSDLTKYRFQKTKIYHLQLTLQVTTSVPSPLNLFVGRTFKQQWVSLLNILRDTAFSLFPKFRRQDGNLTDQRTNLRPYSPLKLQISPFQEC